MDIALDPEVWVRFTEEWLPQNSLLEALHHVDGNRSTGLTPEEAEDWKSKIGASIQEECDDLVKYLATRD